MRLPDESRPGHAGWVSHGRRRQQLAAAVQSDLHLLPEGGRESARDGVAGRAVEFDEKRIATSRCVMKKEAALRGEVINEAEGVRQALRRRDHRESEVVREVQAVRSFLRFGRLKPDARDGPAGD